MLDFTSDNADDDLSPRARIHPCKRPGSARRLFQRRDRRDRTRRAGCRARRNRTESAQRARARRAWLGHRHLAGRSGADQQPCGRIVERDQAAGHRRLCHRRPCARRRSRHRPRAVAGRWRARSALCLARQFQEPAPRPARGRDRQSARIRIDRDGRRGVGARPLDPLGERADHRGRDPDRRRAQSRQFRRAAGVVGGRSDRHQHRDHQRRAGHLLCGRQQHRAVRAVGDHPPRLCPPRLYRRRRPDRADPAAACGGRRRRQQDGRAAGADRAGQPGREGRTVAGRCRDQARRRRDQRRRRSDPRARPRPHRPHAGDGCAADGKVARDRYSSGGAEAGGR